MREVRFDRAAERDVRQLDDVLARRVLERIETLADDPLHGDAIRLKGKPVRYRSRVGDWRIVYEFDTKTLTVLRVANRSEVYKR